MHNVLTAALLAAVTLAPGMVLAANASYDLPPFTGIDISSGIDATVTVGGEQTVRASSPRQGELDELIIEVRDGVLVAKTDWNLLGFLFADDRQLRLEVNVPSLERAEASAGADVDVTGVGGDLIRLSASSGADLNVGDAAGGRFHIEVSSGADLHVDGTCEQAEIEVSSGATLQAQGLTCADVGIELSSGADAEIFAGERLTAEVSSGGDIVVHGDPAEREAETSSGGDIDYAD